MAEKKKTDLTEAELVSLLGRKITKMGKIFGKVDTDGKNKHSGYDYISNEQMVGLLRDNLCKHNLAIFPEVDDFTEQSFSTKDKFGNEKIVIRTVVKMNFKVVDTETGYFEIRKWVGADQDYGGKSMGQAITEATKRFYFKLFQVSSKEEKDPDGKTTDIENSADEYQQLYGEMMHLHAAQRLTAEESQKLNTLTSDREKFVEYAKQIRAKHQEPAQAA